MPRYRRLLPIFAAFALVAVATDAGAQTELCSSPDSLVAGSLPTQFDTIEVVDSLEVEDLEVSCSVTHGWLGSLIVQVESPADTTVTLHNQGGLFNENINLTWTDAGGTNELPYDCDCEMLPSGPGEMADFVGEFSEGDWTLAVTDVESFVEGTLNDWCLIFEFAPPPPPFRRGDINGNGEVEAILDSVALLDWQFNLGAEPPCFEAADVDDDGLIITLLEVVTLLSWQFLSTEEPPAPGPTECGEDPTGDELTCAVGPDCL